jgi:endoglucanase
MRKQNQLFRTGIWHSLKWLLAGWLTISVAGAQSVSKQIIVDQFGWRPSAKKIVVFANPVNGQNNGSSYTPGVQFQVRRSSDNATVFTGNITVWNNGNLHTDSGDKAWHGDFSSVTTPGAYYVFDPANNLRSYEFEVRDDIYAAALKASTRTFYYQRSGTSIPAQHGGNWTHGPAHLQDANALLYTTSARSGTQRNVTGGWYDAGDYNKYIPFLNHTMWNLMVGYELRPAAFTDNTNIPESGNGVPDMLDELKWELDWMLRMQEDNGGVHNRVTVTSYENGSDDPATDTQPRYYTAVTTWSTATFAAITAHAARLYGNYAGQYPGYVNTLRAASEKAWTYLEANPSMSPVSGKDGANTAAADAGSDSNDDKRRRVAAAAELFATTGMAKYKTFFEANYNDVNGTSENGFHPFSNDYLDASLGWELSRAYYVYAKTAGANPAIVSAIKAKFQNSMDWFLESYHNQKTDPYLGMMWTGHYTWGSNLQKALWAMIPILSVELRVNPGKTALYKEIAEEYLHYFHGRNPLSWTYLSNMGSRGANAGAENSVDEFYHSWFRDGSARYDGASSQFGPPPGYIVGGPNQFYSGSASPPKNQPVMKAYRNWNTSYPEPSWEITEPAIYNQAGYTFLVAYFTSPGGTPEQPIVSASSNSPVCSGQTVNLAVTNAPTGATYRWSGPNGFSSTVANPSILNATTSVSGTYSLTMTPTSGTAQTVTTTVTVNTLPTATASSNSPVAAGQSLNLTAANAGNGASYSWKGPNAFGSNLQNPAISNVTTTAAGTYTLTVGLNGCSATATTVVTVTGTNPVPEPSSLLIYEDALQAGWADWSWNMNRNYSATSPVYSGTKSLSIQNTAGWGALYLHSETPISLSTHPDLKFWVHGGATAGQRMQVVINSSGSYAFTPQANQWTLVTVPFSAFGNPATLRDIFIQDVTNSPQAAVYIDQLQLTSTGGTTPPPPTPEPTPGGFLIYDDALKTGWLDWSWSISRNYANGTPVKAGSESLALQYTAGWGGLYLHPETPVNLTPYSQLQFWVHGGPTGGQQFKVTFNSGSQGYTVQPTANTWTLVTIPLTSLGSPASLNDVYFQDTGGAINSVFYVDNLQLSGASSARLSTAEPDEKPAVRVYPNPVSRQQNFVTVSLSGFRTNEIVDLKLADPQGRILRQRPVTVSSAEHPFPLGQLAPGSYLIMVQGETKLVTKKIIVD